MIAIIDYGMGNLKSVYQAISEVNNALQHKQEIIITADKAKIDSADKIIFPGQGAMPDCMQEIEKLNLRKKQLQEKIEKNQAIYNKRNSNPYKIIINKNDNIKYLILIMIICLFAGLVSPLGDVPYTYLYNTMKGNTTR